MYIFIFHSLNNIFFPSIITHYITTVIGVRRYQYSSMNDAPIVFPDLSVDTSTFLDPIRATITIPTAVLTERQGGGKMYIYLQFKLMQLYSVLENKCFSVVVST